jgi:Fic family protein
LRAIAAGDPYDHRRIELFQALADALLEIPPVVLADLPREAGRRKLLPFYEAYFSNFIEGTEFTLDEAARIALDGIIPAARPADAHDVAGTYQITSDPGEMARVPKSSEELLDILLDRHGVVMGGRPEVRPGRFKTEPNRAGSTYFVAPELVESTLRVGFEVGAGLVSPFARAVYMMFLVSEVHPFADGNGRVARLMMNSELVARAEVRITIPTVYRNNYLAALRGVTHTRNFAGLAATLDFARRYTARSDFSDRKTAEAELVRTNALVSPNEADEAGIRLLMP